MTRDEILRLSRIQHDAYAHFQTNSDPLVGRAYEQMDKFSARTLMHLMQATAPGIRGKVLDVGCGWGLKKQCLIDCFGAYYAIEPVPEIVAAHKSSRVSEMFVEDLTPAWRGYFEFIFANHVMEHCADPEIAVDALMSALPPGGVIGHCTPAYGDEDEAHLSQLSLREWEDIYADAGLPIIFSAVLNPALYFPDLGEDLAFAYLTVRRPA